MILRLLCKPHCTVFRKFETTESQWVIFFEPATLAEMLRDLAGEHVSTGVKPME
jgi:hypothetical protein